jgi:hypothetical protein
VGGADSFLPEHGSKVMPLNVKFEWMLEWRLIFTFAALLALISCRKTEETYFEVNRELGFFTIRNMESCLGPLYPEINGKKVLEGAFLFVEKDSLVAIGTQERLDIVSVFKHDRNAGSIQLRIINTGNENLTVDHMQVRTAMPGGVTTVDLVNSNHLHLLSASDLSEGCCLRTLPYMLWQMEFLSNSDSLFCTLNLSGSSVALLPGEELLLPAIQFYNQLCAP